MTNTDSNKNIPKNIALLTCSAGDYAVSQGRKLELYEFVEVNSKFWYSALNKSPEQYVREEARRLECEVVVDIRAIPDFKYLEGYILGTGMRLKKNEP